MSECCVVPVVWVVAVVVVWVVAPEWPVVSVVVVVVWVVAAVVVVAVVVVAKIFDEFFDAAESSRLVTQHCSQGLANMHQKKDRGKLALPLLA